MRGFIFVLIGSLGLALSLSGCGATKSGSGTAGGASEEYGSGESDSGGVGLGTLQRVHFGFDRASLGDEAARILQNNADIIRSKDSMRVLVEGHGDDRGGNEYNISLGERRANAIVDYLVSLGVERSKLETKSWGEERPLDPSNTPSAHALNRRGEFVVLSK